MVVCFGVCDCGVQVDSFTNYKKYKEYYEKISEDMGMNFTINKKLHYPFKYIRNSLCSMCDLPYIITDAIFSKDSLYKLGVNKKSFELEAFFKKIDWKSVYIQEKK